MRVPVLQPVGLRQRFQPEAGMAVLILRPGQAFGSEGLEGARRINEIPARIAVLPSPGVGG